MFLRPELAAPTHVARLTALGIAFAGAAVFALVKPSLEAPRPQTAPAIAIAPPALEVALDVPVASQTEAPPLARASARSVAMVFRAQGAAWMKLESVAAPGEPTDLDGVPRAAMPAHGRIKYTREDYMEIAVAPLAAADVPAAHRARLGSKVVVDGRCTATITGFAVIGRLSGSPGYAGDDTAEDWTAKSVLRHGAPMIAAKLDGCETGTLARDAALPPAATARMLKDDDPAIVAAAKRALLTSKAAAAATAEWRTSYSDGSSWATHEATTWATQMFVHPTTHERFVSVHAHQLEACGSPNINVWGLYRVGPDGALTALDVDLGEIQTIEQFVDVDGDGAFEVVGAPWLGGRLVNDQHGTTLEKLDEPFYGCPC